ncbi:DNA gyrase inhibitor YacG [Sulfitobacter sp. F26204]|uniref:DNA gyrase inhibitor YacG n=1 Tax=Sulfitobacter sp. F26204 TaxID=2996014 RepID=UPI00225E11B0|nr:DNA gyrase inhibitor YacG [Sulfitobacter sp. F26204]MCX7559012.1 DNA gyrase inhibitor YacG [Sulfitobacter sp. F26204]
MSCPMCRATTNPKYRPFCSRRCADLDLAKWFNGSYATPSRDPEDIEAAIELTEAAEEPLQKKH